jgi:hypothetical protein
MSLFLCIFIGAIAVLVAFVCWCGDCPGYYLDQLRSIINDASSRVENPPSARPSPPPSPIPAILKYSVLRRLQNERDSEQKERVLLQIDDTLYINWSDW